MILCVATLSGAASDWPVLEGSHQSRGQDSSGHTEERIVVGRAGGEEAQHQVEADDDDSRPQWRHAADQLNFCLICYLLPLHNGEDDNICTYIVMPMPLISIFSLK